MGHSIGWDFNMTLIEYGDKWRTHRKMMHHALHARAAEQYHAMQERETHKFLQRVINRPENFLDDVRRSVDIHFVLART